MPADVASRDPSPATVRWGLGVLLVASLALRAWMAHDGLAAYKIYDERFSIPNVVHAIENGSLRPVAAYYPSLSYLPHLPWLAASEWLAGLTGSEALRVLAPSVDPGQRFAPAGYLIARWVNALFGVLSIYLCYRMGAGLWGPRAGLWGAVLLAAVPWHARQSVAFKPDIVLVALAPLAFLLAWRAVRSWRTIDFALAGVGIALAAGAKYNGILLALPVVVGAALRGGLRRETLGRLALAGALSGLVFLALNPFVLIDFELHRQHFGSTLELYENLGEREASGHLGVAVTGIRWLTGRFLHGPAVAALALAGLILPLTPRFRPPDRDRRIASAMLTGVVVGYVVVYSAATTNPRAWHNFLLLTPFTAAAAGWALERAGRSVARRLGAAARPLLAVAAALLLVVLFRPTLIFAHTHAVPETPHEASRRLREALPSLPGRVLFDEVGIGEIAGFARQGRRPISARREVRSLRRIGRQRLDRADVEVIDSARLSGESAGFYRQRIERLLPEQLLRIENGLLVGRGPEILLLNHPWRLLAPATALELQRRGETSLWEGRLPPLPPAFLSCELWLPGRSPRPGATLHVGGTRARLIRTEQVGGASRWTTERVRLPARRAVRLRLEFGETEPESGDRRVALFFWRPPGKPVGLSQVLRFRHAIKGLAPPPPPG